MLHSALTEKVGQNNLDTLNETALFQSLPDDVRASLLSAASVHECDKYEMLFVQNDDADWFYLILSGWVKLFRETQDGDEAVIDLVGTGKFVGEMSTFDGEVYTCHAEVTEKALVLRMPISILKKAIETNHSTAIAMLGYMSSKRHRQTQELESLKLQNAPQRIGCFLLRQCEGQTTGSREVVLPYGKSLLATQLGMKGETFSRALAKLKQSTSTEVSSNQIKVSDIEELADFVCCGCSNEYPCHDLLKDQSRT